MFHYINFVRECAVFNQHSQYQRIHVHDTRPTLEIRHGDPQIQTPLLGVLFQKKKKSNKKCGDRVSKSRCRPTPKAMPKRPWLGKSLVAKKKSTEAVIVYMV